MATDFAGSVQAVALRVTSLAASGTPITAATGTSWVTNAFVSIGFTPEYEEGEEITVKAADGTICVYYKVPDVMKDVQISLSICAPEPQLVSLLLGGTLFGTAPNYLGYAAPLLGQQGTPNGVSVEAWSKAIVSGKPAATNPFWWWVFPYVQFSADGERVLENGALASVFTGKGVGNPAFGRGPNGAAQWPYTSASAYQYARCGSSLVPATVGDTPVT